jgi:hypothetical protein
MSERTEKELMARLEAAEKRIDKLEGMLTPPFNLLDAGPNRDWRADIGLTGLQIRVEKASQEIDGLRKSFQTTLAELRSQLQTLATSHTVLDGRLVGSAALGWPM